MPDQLLGANAVAGSFQMEEYKNSGLVVILHCLNSFQHNNYAEFSFFICTAFMYICTPYVPQNKCRLFSLLS